MDRDFGVLTNDLENLALAGISRLLREMPAEMGPGQIGQAISVVYTIQSAREWRAQGRTMLAYQQWQMEQAALPVVVAEDRDG